MIQKNPTNIARICKVALSVSKENYYVHFALKKDMILPSAVKYFDNSSRYRHATVIEEMSELRLISIFAQIIILHKELKEKKAITAIVRYQTKQRAEVQKRCNSLFSSTTQLTERSIFHNWSRKCVLWRIVDNRYTPALKRD